MIAGLFIVVGTKYVDSRHSNARKVEHDGESRTLAGSEG